MKFLRIAILALVVPAAAVWLLVMQDAITVFFRGGSLSVLFLAAALAAGLGLLFGLITGPGAVALYAMGVGISRLVDAFTDRKLAPEFFVATVLGVVIAAGLFPAHETFVKHDLGAWLLTGYAVFPAVIAALWIARQWREGSGWLWALPLAVGVVLHQVNANLYAGLYPELHLALTGVTVVAFALGLLLLLSQRKPGWASLSLAVVVFGALGWFVGGSGERARTAAVFHGTELNHAVAFLESMLDGDGDGVSAWAGDCDDHNALVHPLHYEVPGNQVDDNCGGGDAIKGQRRITREVKGTPAVDGWRAAHGQPNILMVFIDTLRADHVGALGGPDGLTPNLDAFFGRAVVFEQARTTAPRTPHAWMSIIRGRFNSRNLHCRNRLYNPGSGTLPHRLQQGGYRTAARMVGQFWKRYHLAKGWDTLTGKKQIKRISGPSVTRDVVKMARGDTPAFLVAHYADPHAPYKKHPKQPPTDDMNGAYAAEVHATDKQFGALMKGLKKKGFLDNAIVIVFADHGENLGDHGDAGGHHGVSLYDEVVRVPMAIQGPGIKPARIKDPVSVIDLAPTILDLLGLDGLPDADGRSLAGYLFGAPPASSYTISEFYDFDHRLRSIVQGRHKLIVDVRHGASLLFDVVDDPKETRDLSAEQAEKAGELKRLLNLWVDDWADPADKKGLTCRKLVPDVVAKSRPKKKRAKKGR